MVGSVAGAGIVGVGLAVFLARRKRKQTSETNDEQKTSTFESSFGSKMFTGVLFRNRGRNAELDPGCQRHEMEGPIPQEMEAQSPHEMDGQGALAELPERRSEEKKDT